MSSAQRKLWPTKFGVSILMVSGLACGSDDGENAADAEAGIVDRADAAPVIDAAVDPQFMLISANRAGKLFEIDMTTGAATMLLDTSTLDGNGASADVGVISGLEWVDSKSELWAGTGGNATVSKSIQVVNVSTGVLTTNVADTGQGVPSLGLRSSNGLMYMAQGDTSGMQSVDTTSMTYTDIGGAAGGQGNPLAFASDDTMYVVDIN